ncbi:molybdopterin-guanine dinucleotide biosynthesis protein MobB [Brenneria alni]|uniref:molybdopterin-guanine dinucleotide biosynthesis protein MobB n=1 Tax=Brenneria alni TaxID=71656 RepID=UPI00196B0BD8|nr:molybdopterin-guanine dinucleotide biosynthesis protein MobB [Brenneria alni]
MNKLAPPILGIVAYSGTGKTTLLKKLIPVLVQQGIRVGLIKHTHHLMDVDTPGKDSYELRKAGAQQTLVASAERWALMTETPRQQEPNLRYLASRMDSGKLDLILVEGFKQEAIPKILLYRAATGYPFNGLTDSHTLAVASDDHQNTALPQLDIDDTGQIAVFITAWLAQQCKKPQSCD